MIGTRGNTPGDQVAIAFQENQAYVPPVTDQNVAVDTLESGTGHDAVPAGAPGGIDPVGNGMQPWPTVFISKRLAVVHLLDIGLRMKPVAVLVNPMQALRQHGSDRAFAGPGHAHDHDRADVIRSRFGIHSTLRSGGSNDEPDQIA